MPTMSRTAIKPVPLERVIQSKVWGGHHLETMFGIRSPDGQPIGETWELFDRPEAGSALRTGGTLRDLMQLDRRAVLGRDVRPAFGDRFPLLFKFLDAQTELSVQVHPDDAMALAHGDGGKSEAWLVLQTLANARIVRGFKPGTSRAAFELAAHGPEIEDLLYQFTPKVGDCIWTPAGTVHAIGPGAVVFEVQQNSDITWRLYDWGRNRALHTAQAIAGSRVTDGSVDPTVAPVPLPDGGTLLLDSPFFRMRRYGVAQKLEVETDGAFVVVTVLSGHGMLGWHSGGSDSPLRLAPGDCVLVPAAVPSIFLSPIGSLDVVLTDPARS